MAEIHSQIHQQDGTGLPSLHASLKTTIEQVKILPPDLKTGVLRLLDKLPGGNALCHFDFHPGQVILTAKGPVIIDWMTAHQGHPLTDVARTSIILKVGQVPGAGPAIRVVTYFWRRLFYRAYIARYLELHSGLTLDEITTWMIPVAAGRLKEAIPGEQNQLLAFIKAQSNSGSFGTQ
jgi:aminoglycoside phosphotransferase (APT) family kinase protein